MRVKNADTLAPFERHIRELRAFQQEIRQCIARLKARQDRRFGETGDGTLFKPD
jgi:hypothetical protein